MPYGFEIGVSPESFVLFELCESLYNPRIRIYFKVTGIICNNSIKEFKVLVFCPAD
jgi:hypothetical protein